MENRYELIPARVRDTVLTQPYRAEGKWRLMAEEVRKACEPNAVVREIVDYYGGPERWVLLTEGGTMDPNNWPLGLPPVPKPVVRPDILPPGSGNWTPGTSAELSWLPEIRAKLDAILAAVLEMRAGVSGR